MYVVLGIIGLVTSALGKDLSVGHEGGSLKYEDYVSASPAIWRQQRKVTYSVLDSEVITKVDVVDGREDKNGLADIVEGGEGYNNVTIQLKSPSILRGFDFEIRIYAKEETPSPTSNNEQQQHADSHNKQVSKDVNDEVIKGSPIQVPVQDKIQQQTQQIDLNNDIQGRENEQKPLKSTSGMDLLSNKDKNKPDEAQNDQYGDFFSMPRMLCHKAFD